MAKELSKEQKEEMLQELQDIKEELKCQVREAFRIVERLAGWDSTCVARAKGYWYAQFVMGLDKDHSFLGGSMCTMQETIDELYAKIFDDEEEGASNA